MKEAIPLALHHLPVAAEFALLGEDGRFVVLDPLIVEEAAAGGSIAARPPPLARALALVSGRWRLASSEV